MILGPRAGHTQFTGLALGMFTDDELAELHRATLDVMENGGLLVMNDEAREIFYSHGCEVDKKTSIVKIPPYLVEEAIRSAPSKVLLAARDPKYDTVLEATRVAYTTFGVAVEILDSETGKVRESTNKDLADSAILVDAADGVDVFTLSMTPRDVPSEVEDLTAAETCLVNCSKHFHHVDVLTTDGVRAFFEMGAAIAGSAEQMRKRPVCSILICPVSPMQLSPECCEVVIESARLGIPCNVLSMALSGATSPVTNAGTLLTHNAEVLGGITLSQLTRKGAPVIYGSSTTMFDLSCVTAPVGTPEMGLISAAVAKLAQYYNLPSYVSGTQADSKVPDAQAAHEKTITSLLPALAGANLIYGMGMLESGVTWSHEQLIIDNDIVKMVKRAVQGIAVKDDTLATELVKRAHEIKDFLHQKHTVQHMREQSKPKLIDRTTRGTWEAKGSTDMTQRAKEEVRRILAAHQVEPLSDDVKKTLREIVESVAAKRKENASSH